MISKLYGREPKGVKSITVYRPPNSESKRAGCHQSFPCLSTRLPPELIVELVEMTTAQEFRFTVPVRPGHQAPA